MLAAAIIPILFTVIYLFVYFYWDIVVLKCCVSFYCTVEFPVLYSRFLLVIYFIHISVYMSIPISQFIPPPTFPPWCPYVCSLHLCLYFCLANRFICTVFLDSTYALIYDFFSLSDLLHSVWQCLGPFMSLQMTQFRSFLWLTFHRLYVPHLLYLFICRWAFRLLPWPAYCK